MEKIITNEELVEKIKVGDEEALDQLFSRFQLHIQKLARSYFLFGGDHQDLVQEAMIGLYSACNSYKKEMFTSFYSFACLCMKRRVLSAIKSAGRNKNKALNESLSIYGMMEDDHVELYIPQNILFPDEKIEQNEKYEEVKEIIVKTLSKLELKILSLYLKGLSYEEISQKLDITKKSVDNALSRIKNKLKFLTH